MSLGYPVTKTDLDNKMGALIVALRDAMEACVTFKVSMLDDAVLMPDATLTSLGYTAGEITTLRAAFTDIKALREISRANGTQPANNDFWANAKKLTGLNFH